MEVAVVFKDRNSNLYFITGLDFLAGLYKRNLFRQKSHVGGHFQWLHFRGEPPGNFRTAPFFYLKKNHLSLAPEAFG
jgi:hypothetical protein